MNRSYLFAPGHNQKLLAKVFDAGADAVMLDLEDAVPPDAKAEARERVAVALGEQNAWVRVNAVRTDDCAADLDAVGGLAVGIRIPKVESAEDVAWVAQRAPRVPLICAIESARGILAAAEIATAPGVRHLSTGGVDLRRDLNAGAGDQPCSMPALTSSPPRGRPGSRRRSTVSTRTSPTTTACAGRPSTRARSDSSGSRRYTRASCRSCMRCSRPTKTSSRGHTR